jgi:hypothetical protein
MYANFSEHACRPFFQPMNNKTEAKFREIARSQML